MPGKKRLRTGRQYRFEPPVRIYEQDIVDEKPAGDFRCWAFETGTYQGVDEQTGELVFCGTPLLAPYGKDGRSKREFRVGIDEQRGKVRIRTLRRSNKRNDAGAT